VIRFQPGPIFSGSPSDYWAPTNWQSLDQSDSDLGASGPLLVDVPAATPSHLVVALGKDRNVYLINRDNLGGISQPVASAQVASNTILQAAVTYRTKQGTLCRVPRQQRRRHRPLRFPHYCGQSAGYRHPWRLGTLPGPVAVAARFCHLY